MLEGSDKSTKCSGESLERYLKRLSHNSMVSNNSRAAAIDVLDSAVTLHFIVSREVVVVCTKRLLLVFTKQVVLLELGSHLLSSFLGSPVENVSNIRQCFFEILHGNTLGKLFSQNFCSSRSSGKP